ncbi:MAG: hypothetical protein CVU89_00630 [Firmicutes bacterium HGW-Firmicutes-14]|nr:MAG: hypothetical protein CVU89_00630 [Firmicutes bacterium HGW-Firmicutes-14]
MSDSLSPVSLPKEFIQFYNGIGDIQGKLTSLLPIQHKICSLPGKWSWKGENPVISDLKPSIDKSVARELFGQLLKLLVEFKPEWEEDAGVFENTGEEVFGELITCTIEGNTPGFNEIIKRLGANHEVAGFALFQTVKPFLTAFAKSVIPHIDLENWMQRFCPVCGSRAESAIVGSSEGKRYLRCRNCETEWLYKLLSCPWCNNDDHRSLAFLTIEETPGYELHVCERCRGYIKVVDEKKGGNRDLLNDEAATVYLDLVAQQQGYVTDVVNT